MVHKEFKKIEWYKSQFIGFFCVFNSLIYCFIYVFIVLVFIVLMLFQRMLSSNFFACDLSFDDAVKIKKTQHRYAELKIT